MISSNKAQHTEINVECNFSNEDKTPPIKRSQDSLTLNKYSIYMLEYSKQGDVRFLNTIPIQFKQFLILNAIDRNGNTAIMNSILYYQTEAFHYLLKLIPLDKVRLYLNHHNKHGHTALHLTLITRQQDLLNELLQAGADEGVIDTHMRNIYHIIAIENLSPQYIVIILNSLNARSKSGTGSLIDAHLQLLSKYDSEGRAPLHIAIQSQLLSLIKMFTDPASGQIHCFDWSHSQVNKLKQVWRHTELKTGNTPLMLAVMTGNTYYFEITCQLIAASEGVEDSLNDYLNTQNYSGNTALHLAVANNNEPMCATLIKKGSYPFITNYEDMNVSEYYNVDNEEL